jgi:protoporphyrinogen oxidase
MKKSVAVIGSGPMGLMCAYRLLQNGHKVDIFEQDDRIGGMSASFDFDGLEVERYYHFVCKGDDYLLQSLKELGIERKLHWRKTHMGFYYRSHLFGWSSPLALLRFWPVSLMGRFRYALHILYCKRLSSWKKLDRQHAIPWLKRWLGNDAYKVFWENLLHLKYYEYASDLSAAWIAARIQRVALSRKNLWTEELGYLEGGSATFLNHLRTHIEALGGTIHLSTPVQKIEFKENVLAAIVTTKGTRPFDAAVSTIATPLLARMAPDLPKDELAKINAIPNISVVCVVLKMTEAYSKNFWTNINQPGIDIPGIIEYSNLAPLKEHILYVPYYLPASHPKCRFKDEDFIQEVMTYLQTMKPSFSQKQVKAFRVNRCRYAQAVCRPEFMAAMPPIQSKARGFFMADTSFYYPADRSVSESAKLGARLAMEVRHFFEDTHAKA